MSVCLHYCLTYPSCKAHLFCAVLYFHIWPIWLYNIFPHYLINSTIFGKKFLNIKYEFWFSLQILFEIFFILRRTKRYYHKCTQVFMPSTRCSFQILMNLEVSPQIFEKSSNIKFYENPSSGSKRLWAFYIPFIFATSISWLHMRVVKVHFSTWWNLSFTLTLKSLKRIYSNVFCSLPPVLNVEATRMSVDL
jgi:hypothetical protein